MLQLHILNLIQILKRTVTAFFFCKENRFILNVSKRHFLRLSYICKDPVVCRPHPVALTGSSHLSA